MIRFGIYSQPAGVLANSSYTRCAVSLIAASASKKASKVPDRLKRQNRFQSLFQCPNFSTAHTRSGRLQVR